MPATNRPDLAYRYVLALTGALFLSYLAVAMSLSAVPIYVVNGFHLSNAYGGLVVGIAFLAAIVTRSRAGLMGVCTVVPLLGLAAIHRLPPVAPYALSGYAAVFLIGGFAATLGLWMAIQAHRLNGEVSTEAMPRKAVT